MFFKVWVYFEGYKNFYSQKKWKKMRKIEKKVSVSEKKSALKPMPKLDLGFGSQ